MEAGGGRGEERSGTVICATSNSKLHVLVKTEMLTHTCRYGNVRLKALQSTCVLCLCVFAALVLKTSTSPLISKLTSVACSSRPRSSLRAPERSSRRKKTPSKAATEEPSAGLRQCCCCLAHRDFSMLLPGRDFRAACSLGPAHRHIYVHIYTTCICPSAWWPRCQRVL